jgi:hypothetical protein
MVMSNWFLSFLHIIFVVGSDPKTTKRNKV